MKIAAVAAQFPSRILDNDEMLTIIRDASKTTFQGNLDRFLKKIRLLLEYTGAQSRCLLGPNETPLQLIEQAFHDALAQAQWQKEEIDLVIYVGVGRAVIEPGNSYLLAQALGLTKAHCFDILDACMSWVRAMHLADLYLKANIYKKIMIINAEFNVLAGHDAGLGMPEVFAYHHADELEYTLPGATIGEATTVTLLTKDDEKPFEFHFSSAPELADLCTVACRGYELFTTSAQQRRVGKSGIGFFTSYGVDLHKKGLPYSFAILQQLSVPMNEIDIVFTHASSSRLWENAGRTVGMANKIYHIFPQTGNLVSASVPAAMFKAISENKFKRG
ncbi:MAG: 3-oxoacyl-[acyl-carrier-protein] synthase III C-terminal domain-containing protein, partial [Gammaproteobacteria bacterium]